MPCCPSDAVPFFNVPITTIAYTPIMQEQYGPTPRVFVYYFDQATGEYLLSSWFTLEKVVGGSIVVDHGGPQTGFVVIR